MLRKGKIFLLLLFTGISCGSGNRYAVDVSEIAYKPAFYRWDALLFDSKPENMRENMRTMRGQSEFMYMDFLQVMHQPPGNDSMTLAGLVEFVTNPYMTETWAEVKKVFPDTKKTEHELTDAFKHYKYHFPSDTVPESIVFLQTGFGINIVPDKATLGISLEIYLGEKNPIIQKLPTEQFPEYIKKRMDPKYITVDAMKTWIEVFKMDGGAERSLLDKMIFHGKVMYILSAMLPDRDPWESFRYTEDEWRWCVTNERNVWKEIVDHKWLYATEMKMIDQFMNDAPFTATLPQESPSRVGVWVGWKMVKNYMDENPGLSLQDLVNEKDNRKILSYYKP